MLCIEYGEAIIKELIFWKYSKNNGHLAQQLLAQLYKIQDTSMTKYRSPSLTPEQMLLLQEHWNKMQHAIVSDTQDQLHSLAMATTTTKTTTTPERIPDRQK